MNIPRLLGSTAAALALLAGSSTIASAGPPASLNDLRAATDQFHSISVATHDGYGLFKDIHGIACIAMPGMGAMGLHYVNGALVGDPDIIATKPEALVYSPGPDGKLSLAAAEFIVVKSAWDAEHTAAPRLFGHTFNFTDAPNRYGLPPFYSLHVWVWKHNPAGMFQMWNPAVHCPS